MYDHITQGIMLLPKVAWYEEFDNGQDPYIEGEYHLMPMGDQQLVSGHNLVSALTNSLRNICIS